jgi:hypothetical protein
VQLLSEPLQRHELAEAIFYAEFQIFAEQRAVDIFLIDLDHGIRMRGAGRGSASAGASPAKQCTRFRLFV